MEIEPAPTAVAPAAPAIEAPPVPSGPYRLPIPPEVAPLGPYPPFVKPPSTWPILGPAVSVFAVLLWSFVVLGQLTTSWLSGGPIAQSTALAGIFGFTLVAWIVNVRWSRITSPPRVAPQIVARALAIGALSFLLFLVMIVVATVIGAVVGQHDLAIATLLAVVSLVAARLGPRWTSPVRPERTPRMRRFVSLLWTLGVLTTLVAGAELVING